MKKRILTFACLMAVIALPGCANYLGIAVKKGQQVVDPHDLPLTCIVIETGGVSLPLDVIVFENLDTHENLRATLTKSFDNSNSHSDLLTPYRGISIPILHLKPGRYVIKSLEFIGPSGFGIEVCALDIAQEHRYWFVVKPSCVNYVGGLVIWANWNSLFRPRPINLSEPVDSRRFAFRVVIEHDPARDAEWASNGIPGLRGLPSVAAAIEEQELPH
jgi:hypothetical protein